MKLEKSSPSQNLHQAYNLTCQVIEITTALRTLNLTLLKGGERLHSWTFQNDTNVGLVNHTITSPLTPKPWDHRKEATCQVTLDLEPNEQVMIPTSPRLALRTAGEFADPAYALNSFLNSFLNKCTTSSCHFNRACNI